MNLKKSSFLAAILPLLFGGAAVAQMGMGGMGMANSMRGVWNPVIGSGGLYQLETPQHGSSQMQIAIVGQDTVDGKAGYWLEMGMQSPRGGGTMYSKSFYVVEGGNIQVTRMIIQPPGRQPIEMPVGMGQGGPPGSRATQPQPADISKAGQDLGSESVTVPAGTFTAEHYKTTDGADIWVSPKVSPWGLVKMTSPNSNMTLLKVITDAKDQITGTPQVFNPGQMMNGGGGPPQQ